MKKLLGLMVIIFGSIALVGCEKPDYVEEQEMLDEADITQAEAEAIALEEVPGVIVSTTVDDEDLNRIVYQVTIDTETARKEVTVNAETGEIMEVEIDDDDVPQSNSVEQTPTATLITVEEAEQVALEQVPGTVIKTELDDENDAPVYEVKIQTSSNVQDVTVDAMSGQVLYTEIDDKY